MKILFTIQSYGKEVTGGGETFVRMVATHLVGRGHEVHVATSCARSYVGWGNDYLSGDSEIDGVFVHRFPVRHERSDAIFGWLDNRVIWGRRPVPKHLQEEWLRAQGPEVERMEEWLLEHAEEFDIAIPTTYLYTPTAIALKTLAGRIPTMMHPLAHDEPYLNLPLFRTLMKLPTSFGFCTPEEHELIQRKFRIRQPSSVIGIGTELHTSGDSVRFREKLQLDNSPYLLFIGRVDPHKGSEELYESFLEYKKLHPNDLKLVIVGEQVRPLPKNDSVVSVGFVDEQTKRDAIVGAMALVVPSYYESFSMVLTEAWSMGTPALVQGNCAVLKGQVIRANGGIPYHNYAEFVEAVEMLRNDTKLCQQFGASGKAYTETNYDWSVVMDRYESLLNETVSAFASGRANSELRALSA